MQIHVTEEARHICFATSYLRERVPRLSRVAPAQLRATRRYCSPRWRGR